MRVLILSKTEIFCQNIASVPNVGDYISYEASYLNEYDRTLKIKNILHKPTNTQIRKLIGMCVDKRFRDRNNNSIIDIIIIANEVDKFPLTLKDE